MDKFLEMLKDCENTMVPNISVTENGAIGYKTTGNKLVDLNFALSSMRNMDDDEIWFRFLDAYNENPALAVVWLFFARDCREGCGERRVFRVIFHNLSMDIPEETTKKLLRLIPEYGRWDDLIWLADNMLSKTLKNEAFQIICEQFRLDISACSQGKPVSLLGKWMKSENTSSEDSRRIARKLRINLGMSPKEYRKALTTLRRAIRVVEASMSANEWQSIDYQSVPSRASMLYRNAFLRHDESGYYKYLEDVKSGSKKINAGVLFPYEIVHNYYNRFDFDVELLKHDDTLEAQWKALPDKIPDGMSTLVVIDGSGSMCSRIGKTKVTCHDVARSIGIYFAERMKGALSNCFMTFSSRPQIVSFDDCLSLHSKLELLDRYSDWTNTDIEAVFNLLLNTAVKNHLKRDEMPANILIVSDGEFDNMVEGGNDQSLFEYIAGRFESAGYKLPRLVFWNVCSRTLTIPVTENENGVALVSGFSPNICDMVMSAKLDPAAVLLDKLLSDRYKPVLKEVLP